MKFLLAAVNAKFIHSNLAIYSLRAYAGPQYAEQIELAEYTINQQEEQILSDLFQRKPQVIGFSCYIWNWNLIRELLADLPKIMPDVKIWLGGPEVSFDAEKLLAKYPQVCGVMIGEGEKTFRELLACYCEEREPQKLAGTVTREGNFGMRMPISLDEIPFYYSALQKEEMESFRHKIIYYETSRGCPFRCAYCLSSIDKEIRFRSFGLVKKELQFFLDKKVPQVKFIDRTFNCNHQHAQAIWNYLLEHDNGITNFHFEISADLINEAELEIMSKMRPGLIQLEIGVQTANAQALRAIGRTAPLAKIQETVARIHTFHNIHQHLDLIAGLPYEDYASFRDSFNVVYAMRPQQLQLGFLKVLKGAKMEEMAADYFISYQDRPPYEVLCTKWLPYQDVCRLKRIEEMVELYYNSNQFTHVLPILEESFRTPFDLYAALASYYEEKGYLINQPSRLYRYEILLDFAKEHVLKLQKKERQEKADETEEIGHFTENIAENLTFDLYLRENLKSRPAFCADLQKYFPIIQIFYRKEETNPQYLTSYVQKGYDARQMSRMTHIEVFQETKYILFDYAKRDPLTGEAAFVRLKGEDLRENEEENKTNS